ncbi:hypothetical protein JC221_096 [Yersinia phage JC221]|nr:hypothetical protein JC221_096 [Yersinia phage JC221]
MKIEIIVTLLNVAEYNPLVNKDVVSKLETAKYMRAIKEAVGYAYPDAEIEVVVGDNNTILVDGEKENADVINTVDTIMEEVWNRNDY